MKLKIKQKKLFKTPKINLEMQNQNPENLNNFKKLKKPARFKLNTKLDKLRAISNLKKETEMQMSKNFNTYQEPKAAEFSKIKTEQ